MGQKQIVPFTKFDKELAGILTFLRERSNILKQIVHNSLNLAFFGNKYCHPWECPEVEGEGSDLPSGGGVPKF